MINDFEKYYGTVFMEMFEQLQNEVVIQPKNQERTSFLINRQLGLYLKHSSSRSNSWNFGFRESDFQAIEDLKLISKEIAIACICGFHGVCVISLADFEKCTGFPKVKVGRITVRTKLKASWTVTGSLGNLISTRSKTKPWDLFRGFLGS